ncbi:purine-nucleoside phosphorylase [Paenibacillus sp. y28]|uniref:purine-nucleoside phosphorylase n=1 Tax=Paenibacillus sp. y28 TaxID=3129110 RepID=UPI00301760F0
MIRQELSLTDRINQAKQFIEEEIPFMPQIGLILGSGLGVLAESVQNVTVIHYEEIPHFPVSTVEGHAGELIVGELQGKKVLLMKGRFHLYEGYSAQQVAFPIQVMKALGIHTVLITNAAGGVNEQFEAGDLMLITDHLNLMYRNPLIGPNDSEVGVRFPDLSEAYSSRLRSVAIESAEEQGVSLRQGVYAGLLGPSYETPAEIRMLRKLGADSVGMSTVPEVIAARHSGLEVLGISCITNMAAGILPQPLSHDEVMETARRVRKQFAGLIHGILAKL